ncbi:subtype A tannase [Butyrivibrio sp. FCS014]|uniref:subtype A tannase n=1 Tax=Butyrivibrio sp. FCS014 TaxID=1408304 RepID=UPI0004644580|nr:subtype A tannase [Butyrivibrio sp. FCS014]
MIRRKIIPALILGTAVAVTACGSNASTQSAESSTQDVLAETETSDESLQEAEADETSEIVTNLSKIDNTKWQYNEEDNVYYQLGIQYCENPADTDYEELAVIVPAAYMDASDNGDGTYTCTLNTTAEVNGYTAETAPIVFPVNTPGYAAQSPMTEYSSVSEYTDAGFIYVHAGCRGRDAGAPAGVTDLKAAIRYIRYNEGNIAGDMDSIFSFGMSGGGAQSALLGVTGDSELYDDYLEEIGAVMGVSDAVLGSQGWCPITSLDSADEAYEWMMGTTRSDLTQEEQSISDGLTEAYAEYINSLGLTDSEGNALTLEQSDDGRYQAGTYYEYMVSVIEESLNNFLADTEFPYDADASSQGHHAGMGQGGPGGKGEFGGPGGKEENAEGGNAEVGNGGGPGGESDDNTGKGDFASTPEGNMDDVDFTAIDDISRTENSSGVSISGTFETAQDYIDALNANGTWVTYDETTNTAKITSISDFAEAVKTASKGIAAFDQLDESQGENTLFGYGDGQGAHFDSMLAEVLEKLGSDYASDFAEDLSTEDSVGHTVDYRLNMYSPLYYLLSGSDGYKTSNVAKYFRINTGIWQSDTAVNTEANLVLALQNYGSDVDYSFVWGQEHTMAERSGDSTSNFIEWVNECVAAESE